MSISNRVVISPAAALAGIACIGRSVDGVTPTVDVELYKEFIHAVNQSIKKPLLLTVYPDGEIQTADFRTITGEPRQLAIIRCLASGSANINDLRIAAGCSSGAKRDTVLRYIRETKTILEMHGLTIVKSGEYRHIEKIS